MKPEKLYVVRKLVRATSAKEEIRREGKFPVDEVWVDEDWLKKEQDAPKTTVGFKA